MLNTVTITSKRQITIPSKIFKELNLKEGDKLLLKIDNNSIYIKKQIQLLDEMQGSLKLDKKYKEKSIDFIIRDAKKEHWKNRK